MKTLLTLFLFMAIGIGIYTYPLPTPCDQPTPYRVGFIDERFGVSHEEFLSDIRQAAHAWEKASGKSLFVYNPDAKLRINLVYDERQELSTKINESQQTLKENETKIEPRLAEYKSRSARFKEEVASLNSEIERWNTQGGAPPEEFDKLLQRQSELKKEAAELNTLASELNQTADEFNLQAGELNQEISSYNQVVVGKPEEGVYDPKENLINIYYNVNKTELVHTLEHELGHALGLDHINNPKAIMYPRTNTVLEPTADDLALLAKACAQKTAYTVLRRNIELLKLKLTLVDYKGMASSA